MMRRTPLAIDLSAAMLLALISACSTAPNSPAPVIPPSAAAAFIEAKDNAVSSALVPTAWWQLFNDATLNAHVQRALTANADLAVAIANLETARAIENQVGAAQLPATVIESGAGPERANTQPSTSSVPKTSYELGFTLAYEVDLFGRLRAASAAAKAGSEASQAALDTARVAVAADTVAAYIELCGSIANIRLAQEQFDTQQRNLDLVARQLREGEISPLELAQSRVQLERTRTTLPLFEADRRRALFRLATLEGKPPAEADAFTFTCTAAPTINAGIPVGDGAVLIARRPDIREAEHKLAAATAQIGVATAELYPRISIGGSAGRIGGEFDSILTPLITWSFPNQSTARAKIAVAKGSQAAALAQWDAVMLRALREVETTLADYRAERTRNIALRAALTDADKIVQRTVARYRLGADNYLLSLEAQRSRNDLAASLALSDLRIAQIQVALFRALGSGWE